MTYEEYITKIKEAISPSELDDIEGAVENDEDLISTELESLLDEIDTRKGDFE